MKRAGESMEPQGSSRRSFLRAAAGAAAACCSPLCGAPAALARAELRIDRIILQESRGRRLTPVAPNAYAPYRGHEVRETLVRVRAKGGLEGVGVLSGRLEAMKQTLAGLLGLDAFALFDWDGDVVRGPAESRRELLGGLFGADTAILDLLGQALRRPIADLLGKRCRDSVTVYDSSLYMEDLLKPAEREGLAYMKDAGSTGAWDPVEAVARKAVWVLGQEAGVRTLKIKIGRAKWMGSFDEARDRDVAVFLAVRKAVGRDVALFVDGNDGYAPRPLDALVFARAAAGAGLYAMEEMFPESKLAELREVKSQMLKDGIRVKLADGESPRDGISTELQAERVAGPLGEEPLFAINQPDMNQNGLLRLRSLAGESARRGLTLAPHNFGSKIGFYPQVHLGLVTPSWEFSEMDDSRFPGLEAPGIDVRGGQARLTGAPGLGVRLREELLEKPALVLEA